MKLLLPDLDDTLSTPLYIQLYQELKTAIMEEGVAQGDKLPSLRTMAKNLGISITTVQLSYNQLLVEGYVVNKPQSGYFVAQNLPSKVVQKSAPWNLKQEDTSPFKNNPTFLHDIQCFDFNKWKKCSSTVFNDYSHLLLFESDPQGEAALRHEISKYLFSSRGVICTPAQIVIGAGTQQITSQLCIILSKININHVSLESPGYLPVQSTFLDRGFALSHIPVESDGIDISKLPANIPSAVYVSPSNQFPTGAVMPIGRRYQLLDWARQNNSIIIEDDYDSELRYFGRPMPSLQSLDHNECVVYLGSFSSTLFPAIKISYMVLPSSLADIFSSIKNQYTQTCSKAEQLTLALFMEKGYYYTGIRKLRNLYSQKLQKAIQCFAKYGCSKITTTDTQSGINLTIGVHSKKSADELCALAKSIGLQMIPLSHLSHQETSALIFYYNQIPLQDMDSLLKQLSMLWELD